MYNLARIYFYDESLRNNKKSIELLIKSIKSGNIRFESSFLSLVLIHTFGFRIDEIRKELIKKYDLHEELVNKICQNIISYNCFGIKKIDFISDDILYNENFGFVRNNFLLRSNNNQKKIPEINALFYEGFGIVV